MFGFKIKNMRKGPFGKALAFLDVAFGDVNEDGVFVGVCEVRGCVLKDGSKGFYVQFPAKARLDKEGQPAKDSKGYAIYDNHFDLYIEGEGEERKPTADAWDFRRDLILAAQHAYEAAGEGNKGRGAKAAPKAAPKPAEAKGEIDGDEAPSPVGADDDDDDSLPF
jgi:hypothetical protein